VLAAVYTLASGAVPAMAAPGEAVRMTEGPISVLNSVTGLCLTGADNGSVHTEVCNGSRYQLWVGRIVSVDGNVEMWADINLQTQQCLENDGYGNGYGNLHTAPCNGSRSQAWYGYGQIPRMLASLSFIPPTQIAYVTGSFVTNAQTQLCLESDVSVSSDTYGPVSGNAYAQQCAPYNWQYWATGPAIPGHVAQP
jgi:hypothetical protein